MKHVTHLSGLKCLRCSALGVSKVASGSCIGTSTSERASVGQKLENRKRGRRRRAGRTKSRRRRGQDDGRLIAEFLGREIAAVGWDVRQGSAFAAAIGRG